MAVAPLRQARDQADRMPRFPLVIAHRRDKALGPAARWLIQRLTPSPDENARGTVRGKSARKSGRPS